MPIVIHKSHTGLTKTGIFSEKRQVCQHASSGTLKPSDEKSESREISEKRSGFANCEMNYAETRSDIIRPESRCGFATGTEHEFSIQVVD